MHNYLDFYKRGQLELILVQCMISKRPEKALDSILFHTLTEQGKAGISINP